MISRLEGRILDCTPGRVVVDVNGVGYDVQIPLGTFYALSAGREPTAGLYVHTHVREDALQLFGFFSHEERVAFEQLIGISGVGPKLALAILSGIGAEELTRAIRDQDRGRLQKIPGVGKKTAERLLLELRDKVGLPAEGGGLPGGGPGVDAGSPALREDAVSALLNLGYARSVAERAVDASLTSEGDPATLESMLKSALGKLVR